MNGVCNYPVCSDVHTCTCVLMCGYAYERAWYMYLIYHIHVQFDSECALFEMPYIC